MRVLGELSWRNRCVYRGEMVLKQRVFNVLVVVHRHHPEILTTYGCCDQAALIHSA